MSAASGEAALYQRLRAHLDLLKLPAAARDTPTHMRVSPEIDGTRRTNFSSKTLID